jgi:hypothetical protein
MRESLTWTNVKISLEGYTNDEDIYTPEITNLGSGYEWNPDPPDRVTGGTLTFKTASTTLNRQESTESSAGKWE